MGMKTQKTCLDAFQIKKVGSDVYVEGFANKAVVDRGGDKIMTDAWNLENYKKVPMILFNHDKDRPIGKAVDIRATDNGLWVKAKISNSADPEISKIRDLISEGMLNAFSVGFDAKDEQKSADGFNEIKAAELYEISVVTLPMNQDSIFSLSAKSLAGLTKEQAVNKILREKGALVAAELQDGLAALGGKKEDVLNAICTEVGCNEEEMAAVLSGNVTPVPDAYLAAFAKLAGLDAAKLAEMNKQDVDDAKAPEAKPEAEASMPAPQPPPEKTEEKAVEQKGQVGILSILVPKDKVENQEAAAEMVQGAGYKVDAPDEDDMSWAFYQDDPSFYSDMQTTMDIGDGIMAVVGFKKESGEAPIQDACEPKPEEKAEVPADNFDPKDLEAMVAEYKLEVDATQNGTSGNPAAWIADEALWEKAKRASEAALGEISYPFVVWFYLKQGGGKKSDGKNITKAVIPGGGSATMPLDDNPYLAQSRQTNILLGVLIEEIKHQTACIMGKGSKPEVEQPQAENESMPAPTDDEEEMQKAIVANVQKYLSDLEVKLKKLGA